VKNIIGGNPVYSLLAEFPDLSEPESTAKCATALFIISGPPVNLRPRQLVPDRLHFVKAEFDDMLRDGTARRSESFQSSALHIVLKIGNGWRLCGSYRALNARPIPFR
jgi:hypothetical protein